MRRSLVRPLSNLIVAVCYSATVWVIANYLSLDLGAFTALMGVFFVLRDAVEKRLSLHDSRLDALELKSITRDEVRAEANKQQEQIIGLQAVQDILKQSILPANEKSNKSNSKDVSDG